MSKPPEMLELNFENIPCELKAAGRWVCWKSMYDGKAWKKKPFCARRGCPRFGKVCDHTDPNNWSAFSEAREAFERGGLDGIGFALGDSYAGIDLDDCRDLETGEIAAEVREVIERFDSYAEVSPSGTGIKIFCKGKLPHSGKRGSFEGYSSKKYFTVTGHHIQGTPTTVEVRQEALDWFAETYLRAEGRRETATGTPTPSRLTDDEVILKASAARNGAKFSALFRGCWQDYDYPSDSEADLAFAGILAFWTGKDADQIERVMRRSGLARDKWDRHPTYLRMTIDKAIAGCSQVYAPPPNVFPLNEIGNGQRFVAHFGDDVRYSFREGCWYLWDGKRWKRDAAGRIRELAKRIPDLISAEAAHVVEDKTRAEIYRWAGRTTTVRARENALRDASSIPDVQFDTAEERPDHAYLLNCNNGTLDLRTGTLHPHMRGDGLTKLTPIDYYPNAKCPRWSEFLNFAMGGNAELVEFLRTIMGISLSGVMIKHVFFVYGPKDTGKTTFISVLQKLAGEYARVLEFSALTVRKHDDAGRPTPELARLHNARLVTCSETLEMRRFDEALLKRLSGGDTIAARRLHEDLFEFTPCFKIWVYGNDQPLLNADDPAVWRRVIVIPFQEAVPPDKRIENNAEVVQRFVEELSGILTWAVEGVVRWFKGGCKALKIPAAFSRATDEYRDSMDILSDFLGTCCEMADGARVQKSVLFDAFQAWCAVGGITTKLTYYGFNAKVRKRPGIKEARDKTARCWEGIRLTKQRLRIGPMLTVVGGGGGSVTTSLRPKNG